MAEWIVELGDGNIHIKKMSPLVRCKDCKHLDINQYGVWCHHFAHDMTPLMPEDFCSRGERMDEVEE